MKEWYHIHKQGNSYVIPIRLSYERPKAWEYNLNHFIESGRTSISMDDITKDYKEEISVTSLDRSIYKKFIQIIFEEAGFTQ